jgi:hypothetical protein
VGRKSKPLPTVKIMTEKRKETANILAFLS